MQGGWCAGRGAGQAFRASMASQLPTMKSLASWLPEIILGSTLCKPLQVPAPSRFPCSPTSCGKSLVSGPASTFCSHIWNYGKLHLWM